MQASGQALLLRAGGERTDRSASRRHTGCQTNTSWSLWTATWPLPVALPTPFNLDLLPQ